MRIEVLPSAAAAATAAALLIAEQVAAAPAEVFTLGLAGGSTPRAAYQSLRSLDVPWERVLGWLSDERWVPGDHPDSNGRMARDELVDHVEMRLLRPDTSLPDPHLAAARYQGVLWPALAPEGTPAPDLTLLGIGEDGHTASLFPGTEALDVDRPGFVANWVPALDVWRLTATIGLLAATRTLAFLITGSSKADMVGRILADEEPFPARLVAEAAVDVVWLLDESAASRL